LTVRPPAGPAQQTAAPDPTDTDASVSRDHEFREEALPELDAVYRFALRLTRDPDHARDLVQETFLRAWTNWEKYTPGTRAKSWLFTICRNLFLRRDGRSRRHDELVREFADQDPRGVSREATVFMAAADHDPEGAFWSRIVDKTILREIEALPAEFRETVVLSDMEGLAYQEIADVLDVPVGTVKSRLFRGRRILQERLYDYAVAEGIIEAPRDPAEPRPPEGDA